LLVLYILGILYMFVALAIVCDEFFVPSLEILVDCTGISMDVAGATFMAAGGSMPELFTSFVGTFQGSDIGFSAIVGSAVFNVLFVIGVCAMASRDVLRLTWWPLIRDCSFYIIGLLTLVFFLGVSSRQKIEGWEAGILLAEYVAYCFFMKHNEGIRRCIMRLVGTEVEQWSINVIDAHDLGHNHHFKKPSTFRAGIVELLTQNASISETAGIAAVTQIEGNLHETFDKLDVNKNGFIEEVELAPLLKMLGSTDIEHLLQAATSISRRGNGQISFDDFRRWYIVSEARIEVEVRRVFEMVDHNSNGTLERNEISALLRSLGHHPRDAEVTQIILDILSLASPEDDDISTAPSENEHTKSIVAETKADDGTVAVHGCNHPKPVHGNVTFQQFSRWYRQSLFWQDQHKHHLSEERAAEVGFSIEVPDDPSDSALFWFFFTYPICSILYVVMPDVRRPKHKGRPVTIAVFQFLLSLCWIAFFSFCLVDWATVASNTVGIPAPVAGVTVLAAGTSIPDLISSYIVAEQGEGDMAVSSSIGSNIFDILVGLPLPWLCFNILKGGVVEVKTKSLGFSVLLLICMLVLVIAIIISMRWRMTKAMGFMMFVLYVVFVVQDLLQQLPEGSPVFTVSF